MAERAERQKTPAKKTEASKAAKPSGLSSYLADPTAKEFDRLVYERVRLGMLSALAVNATLTFSQLKQLLETSDGNLSVHARKLEEADYVSCKKTFEDRHPKTEYRLTARGRRALERYLNHMEALIQATRSG